ncbi:MAG TPA: DUF4164 family protein [Beijerinckiaceae bacterium]|nr:DUF4164 family protein [Beijerinckiaceae bacterium]
MSRETILEALARCGAALDRLEAASLRHQEGERLRMNLESELALMRADRQALAEKLDAAFARTQQVEEQVSTLDQRIGRAVASIRDVLDGSV